MNPIIVLGSGLAGYSVVRELRKSETPAHPVAVSPLARDAVGAWQELASGNGVKMGFVVALSNLTGIVLTGEYASERNEMAKRRAV